MRKAQIKSRKKIIRSAYYKNNTQTLKHNTVLHIFLKRRIKFITINIKRVFGNVGWESRFQFLDDFLQQFHGR